MLEVLEARRDLLLTLYGMYERGEKAITESGDIKILTDPKMCDRVETLYREELEMKWRLKLYGVDLFDPDGSIFGNRFAKLSQIRKSVESEDRGIVKDYFRREIFFANMMLDRAAKDARSDDEKEWFINSATARGNESAVALNLIGDSEFSPDMNRGIDRCWNVWRDAVMC